MPSKLQLFTVPPAPPPPGFHPEDASLYKQLGLHVPRGNRSSEAADVTREHTECTAEERMAARESNILRTLTAILPSKPLMTDETLLMLWRRALAKKRMIVTLLAEIQLDCEELECDVVDRLGEEIVKETLGKVYDLGDASNVTSRLMLSISNVTYKSVEILDS